MSCKRRGVVLLLVAACLLGLGGAVGLAAPRSGLSRCGVVKGAPWKVRFKQGTFRGRRYVVHGYPRSVCPSALKDVVKFRFTYVKTSKEKTLEGPSGWTCRGGPENEPGHRTLSGNAAYGLCTKGKGRNSVYFEWGANTPGAG